MTQHINLLSESRRQLPRTVWLLVLPLLGLLLPLGLWVNASFDESKVAEANAQDQSRVAQLQAVLDQTGKRDAMKALEDSIAQTKDRIKLAGAVKDKLPELGRPGGYSAHLKGFSVWDTPQVWIKTLELKANDGSVVIAGNALSADEAMTYFKAIQPKLLDLGSSVQGVEITRIKDAPVAAGAVSQGALVPGGPVSASNPMAALSALPGVSALVQPMVEQMMSHTKVIDGVAGVAKPAGAPVQDVSAAVSFRFN